MAKVETVIVCYDNEVRGFFATREMYKGVECINFIGRRTPAAAFGAPTFGGDGNLHTRTARGTGLYHDAPWAVADVAEPATCGAPWGADPRDYTTKGTLRTRRVRPPANPDERLLPTAHRHGIGDKVIVATWHGADVRTTIVGRYRGGFIFDKADFGVYVNEYPRDRVRPAN